MFDKLQAIEERYDKLTTLISDPAVQADQREIPRSHKSIIRNTTNHRTLSPVQGSRRRSSQAKELADEAKEDDELRELAQQELVQLEERRENSYKKSRFFSSRKIQMTKKMSFLKLELALVVTRPVSLLRICFECMRGTLRLLAGEWKFFRPTKPGLVQ
ncbi:MAG: hypothetical protein Ct9H300mP25_10860 [Acidobacteriota bacterium]|nr:MAG: hypothetical protein Ct9H300mP25_10860 [Acidobacteriota bacterium]